MLSRVQAPSAQPETVVSDLAEQRRIRFSSIEGLVRDDLALACDVWRRDVLTATWAERESWKLAIHFTRYICNPEPSFTQVNELEGQCQMCREEITRALSLMRNYGSVDSFDLMRNDIKVMLHLSPLQRLRVLEAKARMRELSAALV